MVPLVCSQQQKFVLRSQVPEKPPADGLSPCSPCSSPSPSPCSLCSLELFVLWLVMVLYFTYDKAKPPLCSGAPHRAQQKPSIQQPSNLGVATDLTGMGGTGVVSFLPVWNTPEHYLFPLGPICGLSWLSPRNFGVWPNLPRSPGQGLHAKHHFTVGVPGSQLDPFCTSWH